MNYLEEEILKIIEKRYKRKYVGGLKVTKLSSGGYKLVLYLGNPDAKELVIAGDFESEQDFLKYVDCELKSRQLIKVQFFKGVINYPEDVEGRTCKKD